MSEAVEVNEDYLFLVSPKTRAVFSWLFPIVFIFAIVGNLCAIRSIIKRKCKILQKTCIISLAFTDILAVTVFTVNTMESFSHEKKTWTIGEFLCHFIPMTQLHATTTSSIALLIISLDRYHNIIYALSKKWNPNIYYCIGATLGIYILVAVIAYPMYAYFNYYDIIIVRDSIPIGRSAFCVSPYKNEMIIYFSTILLLIFVPLLVLFIWFYVNIAKLIWQHRKPPTVQFNSTESTRTTNQNSDGIKSIIKKSKSVQVERKLRSFKIVLIIMIVFVMCRLPYWIFYMITTATVIENSKDLMWNLKYILILLNMINCIFNPLFYTFTNQTIQGFKIIKDFMGKICCFCCSKAEFEDFERENAFVIEKFVEDNGRIMKEQPQSSVRSSRVKMEGDEEMDSSSNPKF